MVIARSFARIHWQNLVNFGVLPLTFIDPSDYDRLKQNDMIRIVQVSEALSRGNEVAATVDGWKEPLRLLHTLSLHDKSKCSSPGERLTGFAHDNVCRRLLQIRILPQR